MLHPLVALSSPPRLDMWKRLLRDPVVLFAMAVTAVSAIPYVFPVFSPDGTLYYTDLYADLPLLGVCIFAFQLGLRRVRHSRTRRFWNLLTAALGCWVLVRILNTFLWDEWFSYTFEVGLDLLYVAFYLFIAVALQLEPHRDARHARLLVVRRTGAIVFAFGLLIYFAALPAALEPAAYDTWVPSLLLYSVLDLYLIFQLAWLLRRCVQPMWRATYSFLLVTACLWLATDSIEALAYAEVGIPVYSSTPLDLIWYLPFLSLIAAARTRSVFGADRAAPHERVPTVRLGAEARLWGGPIVAFAVAFPLIHYGLYAAGVLDPALKPAREAAVFVVLAMLAGLILIYQMRLEAENKRLARRSVEMTERLSASERLEAIGQLTGGIAHDFNNLLTVVLANTDLVRMSVGSDDESAHRGLNAVQGAAERGAALVKKLLGFGRREELAIRKVDLSALVEDFCASFRCVVPATIEIECSTRPDIPDVQADTGALEQILVNLLSNARDAMPEGGVVRVATRFDRVDEDRCARQGFGRPGSYGCLFVTDGGVGMESWTRRRIFEPFFTTKPVGRGTGMGMSVVYGLVKQLGGFIDVKSRPGEGTSIAIWFPVVAVEQPDVLTPSPTPVAPGRLTGTETILLAEDEPAVGLAGKRLLEEHGYTVLLARDGVEAFEEFERQRDEIDLVISDVVMPRAGGADFYRRLRAEEKDVPFLFVSGYPASELDSDIQPLDVPLVAKPWNRGELLARVRELLDAARPRRTPLHTSEADLSPSPHAG